MKFSRTFLPLLAALGLSSSGSNAQVLMFDFGTTTVTGASQTNSPYHKDDTSFTGSTWNKVGTSDLSSLSFANGEAATGVSFNLGATTATTTSASTLVLSNTPSGNSALGTVVNTGVYADSSVGKDGIFTGSNGSSDARAVGFQLTGLTAGLYDVYVTARNTNTSNASTQTAFVGTSAIGDFVLNGSGMVSDSISYAAGASSATGSWEEGQNYLKFTISLTAGQALNVATLGGTGDKRGFLNSVQIVAVPEPTSMVLLTGGLVAVMVFRRRSPLGVS